MLPQVRAAALTHYVETAQAVGLAPYDMLRAAGIPADALVDPEQALPIEPVAGLLEESARRSGCESFGLRMAERRSLGSLGPVSLMLAQMSTAREVIRALIRYQALLADALLLELEPAGDAMILRTELAAGRAGRQSIELVMGIACRTIGAALRGTWHPESAHFVHPAPADLSVHRRLFRCDLQFESGFNGFVCPADALDAANPVADPELATYAGHYLDRLLAAVPAGSVEARARRALFLLVPTGNATLDRVADALGVHPRTLQRQLEREQRPFATLLRNVRRELAMRQLTGPDPSITAAAQVTGYATPSAFTRWFHAEFGIAPARWRAAFVGAALPAEICLQAV